MLERFRAARLLWPTVFAMAGVAVLIGLGRWQIERKVWKEALIARLEAAAKAEPVALADLLPAADLSTIEFRRVRIRGRFWHGNEFHVWSPGPRGPAWSIVTPLALTESPGNPERVVFVIRGVLEGREDDSATRQAGPIDGDPVEIVGRIRLDRPSPFTTPPEPGKNQWMARDLKAMSVRLVPDAKRNGSREPDEREALDVLPVFVEAETRTGGSTAPTPRLGALTLTNRHLEYALTWFGLAATLAAVYAAFAAGRLRATAT